MGASWDIRSFSDQFCGWALLSKAATLRDVEDQIDDLEPWARTLIPQSISDTTLDTEARRLDEPYLYGL